MLGALPKPRRGSHLKTAAPKPEIETDNGDLRTGNCFSPKDFRGKPGLCGLAIFAVNNSEAQRGRPGILENPDC